jgi:hypothetical protein
VRQQHGLGHARGDDDRRHVGEYQLTSVCTSLFVSGPEVLSPAEVAAAKPICSV